MATPGQPTLYKPEYCDLAHNYCRLGATNETLGDFFGVTRRTIQNWIATHPDFADAVKRGRAAVDAVACTDRLLLQFEKALLPVTVISYPCNGTQKFLLLRAEPTRRERRGESRRHAGD